MKTTGTAWIGGTLENPKSQHWHWRTHQRWARGWRELTAYICKGMVDADPSVPKRIRLVAHVKRRFDPSNLPVVLSPILDGLQVPRPATLRSRGAPGASVIDDDGSPAHRIRFEQVVDLERQGVEVTVEVIR